MAWTAGAVAALLVTLCSSSVPADDPGTSPWTEIMLLKPKAAPVPMNIIVLAEDEYGFNVTLEEKCFPSDSPWHFTQVNVTKVEHGELLLNLTVGACEVNCTLKDLELSEGSGSLGNITVIPLGLEEHWSTKKDTKTEKPAADHYTDLTDCTEFLHAKPFNQCDTSACTTTKIVQNSATSAPATTKTVQDSAASTHATTKTVLNSAAPRNASACSTSQACGHHCTLDTVLLAALAALVVQVLGTAVMAMMVFVVIRRATR